MGVLVAAYIIYFKVSTGHRRRGMGLLSLHRAFSMLGSLQLGMRGWRKGRNVYLILSRSWYFLWLQQAC